MIYCVKFADVELVLEQRGWRRLGETEGSVVFRKGDPILVLPKPNIFGDLPEMLFAAAFDAANEPLPKVDVFWCD